MQARQKTAHRVLLSVQQLGAVELLRGQKWHETDVKAGRGQLMKADMIGKELYLMRL